MPGLHCGCSKPSDGPGSKRHNRSVLIAVSVGYGCGDESFPSFPARTRAMGAPIRKCVRINANAHDDMPVGLESPLHFLRHLKPLLPGAWHLVAVDKNSQKRRVIFLVDP